MTDCEKYSNSVIKPSIPMKKKLEYVWVNPIPRVVYPAVMTVSCRDGPLCHDTIGST